MCMCVHASHVFKSFFLFFFSTLTKCYSCSFMIHVFKFFCFFVINFICFCREIIYLINALSIWSNKCNPISKIYLLLCFDFFLIHFIQGNITFFSFHSLFCDNVRLFFLLFRTFLEHFFFSHFYSYFV